MNIGTIVRRSQKYISDNAPAILTGAAIVGTVASTIFAGRAGFKAGYMVAQEELTRPETETTEPPRDKKQVFRDRAKQTWHLYLPSAATGVGTIAAIAMANRINSQRLAGLAAAYTITDKAFAEYKDKVKETIGEKKETEVQDKIAQDRVDSTSDKSSLVVISNGDVLCYDMHSDRYFQSSMEKIQRAVNETNHEIIHSFAVSLSEFYAKLGLPKTGFSDEVGWNSDNLMDVHFTTTMTPEERPCLAFRFHVDPVRRYDKTHG